MQLFLKILSRMEISVSPDLTGPSGSTLFANAILSETLGVQNLRTFTVNTYISRASRILPVNFSPGIRRPRGRVGSVTGAAWGRWTCPGQAIAFMDGHWLLNS